MGSIQLTAWVALVLTLTANNRFWAELAQLRSPLDTRDLLFFVSVFLTMFIFLAIVLTLVSFPYIQQTVATLLLIVSAVIAHFTTHYGVLIDSTMMQNTFETDPGEVRDLIGFNVVARVVLLGVLPSAAVWWVRVRRGRFLAELGRKAGALLAGVLAALILVGSMYSDYASSFPQKHALGQLATPLNVLYATGEYLRKNASPTPRTVKSLGLDAALAGSAARQERKNLLVVVVGETARSAEFSLNGYARETNPELAQQQVISYPNVHACGTSTAIAIPCMFSRLEQDDFDSRAAREQEGLLDVLDHAGVRVLWRDNNSGCKGACDRIEAQLADEFGSAEFCDSGECLDEALLSGLDAFIDGLERHAVIVLHQKGSHGPAYYRRYPEAFRRFLPECVSNQLQECSHEQVVNTYDNTILYTDRVLSLVIDLLRRHEGRLNTAMLYVSDHGESLGEGNLYLHGLPYAIAPDEQTRVPMIVWLSPEIRSSTGIDWECLEQNKDLPLTHDNLFHSVLGLMSVETGVYESSLDLFAACRSPGTGNP
jgi:lipid A ethanolaminephosphotransferase